MPDLILIWNPDPTAFTAVGIPIDWYGILFAAAFLASQRLVILFYRREGRKENDLLLVYLVVGVVVGARLGHCLLYDPSYYLMHPLEILEVWKGGLASHGGAAGIVAATYLFSRKYPSHRFLWLLDRIAIVAALFGTLVRVGNFVNSEIIGKPTGSAFGVVFARPLQEVLGENRRGLKSVTLRRSSGEPDVGEGVVVLNLEMQYSSSAVTADSVRRIIIQEVLPRLEASPASLMQLSPRSRSAMDFDVFSGHETIRAVSRIEALARHPVQLYEGAAYLLLFVVLFLRWKLSWKTLKNGTLLGMLLVILFGSRLFLELFKEPVVQAEATLPFKLGQLASVPFVIAGLLILWWIRKKRNLPAHR